MKPSNYVSISRNNASVRGTWLLDSSLSIPNMFLAPLSPDETEETRKNLYLKSSNGSIDAEITLAPYTLGDDLSTWKRLTMYTRAMNGPIKILLVYARFFVSAWWSNIQPNQHTPHIPRLPFYLNIEAYNGPVTIYLPRAFNGLLSIKQSHGSTKFSHEVSMHLVTFNDVDRMHKCFIGDFPALKEGEKWQGDEIVIDARNGSVKVHYEDEVEDRVEKQPGIFGNIFRF